MAAQMSMPHVREGYGKANALEICFVVDRKWADLIFSGEKTAEIRSTCFSRWTGTVVKGARAGHIIARTNAVFESKAQNT